MCRVVVAGLRRRVRAPGRRRAVGHVDGRRRRGGVPAQPAPRRAGDAAHPRAQHRRPRDPERRASPSTAFSRRSEQAGLADPNRPVWIVDDGPRGGETAYTNTWALGRVAPGQTKTFEWRVTPVEAGDAQGLLPRRRRPGRQGQGARSTAAIAPRARSPSRSPRSPRSRASTRTRAKSSAIRAGVVRGSPAAHAPENRCT